MRSKLLVLTSLFLLFFSVYAWGEQNFGPEVETDTSNYFTIQNFFLSPFQLSDYNFLGGGAKARGMGGAFFAVSDDPSAASWNPAGLSQLEKPQMNVSFSSYKQRTNYTSTSDYPKLVGYSSSDKLKYDANAISFASVAIPFKIRGKELVGGVLYQKLADIYQENRYSVVLHLVSSDSMYYHLLPPLDEKVTGSLNEVNLSLGTKLFKSLSVGTGVSIYSGKFTSDMNMFSPLVGTIYYQGYLWPYIDYSGRNGYKFHPHIESDYSGFNFKLGVMYMLKKLHLAGVVRTPFTLKEDNDVKLFTDVIKEGVILESPSILASPFFKTDRKWKMPIMIGFGGSYQMNALTLAADIEFRNYSKTEVTYRKNIADPSGEEVKTGDYLTDNWWGKVGNNPPFVPSLGWRNLTQFRIGGEYMFKTRYGNIPIRLGYRNDPKLTKQLDSNEVYLRMDMYAVGEATALLPTYFQSNYNTGKGSWVNGNVFSMGTGISWSQIKLDISFEFARYPEVEKNIRTSFRPFDIGNRVLYDPFDYQTFAKKESNNYNRITISFTGFF